MEMIIRSRIPKNWIDYEGLWAKCGRPADGDAFCTAVLALADSGVIESRQGPRMYYRRAQ